MSKSLPLNTSYKYHILIGFIISIWLVFFLVLIAPFDASELSFRIRAMILPPYGLISFVTYILVIPLQNYAFKKFQRWNLFLEIAFIFAFNLLCFPATYLYYKSSVINGDYEFLNFTFEIYTPILVILLSVIVFTRWYLNNKIPQQKNPTIILTGDNKLDVLKIRLNDLICVTSADNYVEINYLADGKLQKKLLRSTLKKVSEQQTSLLKVHRSYLINPFHFKEWKNSTTLLLTEMEVPISKSYKRILAESHSPLKVDGLSQTQ